jgi:hypothetical protein
MGCPLSTADEGIDAPKAGATSFADEGIDAPKAGAFQFADEVLTLQRIE